MWPNILTFLAINLALIALFSFLIYRAQLELMAWRINKRLKRGQVNQDFALSEGEVGYNPANIYFCLAYDCRKQDVIIGGVVPPAKSFNIAAYDKYTCPLPSCLTSEKMRLGEDGAFEAILTARPSGRPNEINVKPSPKGDLIIRVGLARNPAEVLASPPYVKAVA